HELGHVVSVLQAVEADPVPKAEADRELLQAAACVAIADDVQSPVSPRSTQLGERLEQVGKTLHRYELADEQDTLRTRFCGGVGCRKEHGRIDRIRDHLESRRNAVAFDRSFQRVTHGKDPVGPPEGGPCLVELKATERSSQKRREVLADDDGNAVTLAE